MAKASSYKKWIISLAVFVGIVLGINFYLSNLIEEKIKAALLQKIGDNYTSHVENVRFQLLDRSIIVDNFEISPTSDAVSNIILKDAPVSNLNKISIGKIRIRGIHFLKLLNENFLKISKVVIKDVNIRHLYNPNVKLPESKNGSINYDSISLKKLTGLEIKKIELDRFNYEKIDVLLNKKALEIQAEKLTFGEIILEPYANDLFKLKPIDKLLLLRDFKSTLYNSKYKIEIANLSYNNKEKLLAINDMALKPIISLPTLATSYRYTKAAFDADISRINVYNFNFKKLIKYKSFFSDSIVISGVDMSIYKDKRKPFNTKIKHPLPHVRLKNMKDSLLIEKLRITDSKLKFEQILKDKDLHMKLFLHNIDAKITHITSVKALRETPMELNFKAKFMTNADLNVNVTFPMKDNGSLFHVKGHIGKTKFKYFDSAIYPILGIKILKGNLDDMTFRATATNSHAKGRMTLLYHNLEAKVFKSHSREKNKFLSWGVNTVLHSSNPVKGKSVRIAEINTERVEYKGFVQYVWSMVQSGLINTLTPVGKTINDVENKIIRKKKNPKKKKKK